MAATAATSDATERTPLLDSTSSPTSAPPPSRANFHRLLLTTLLLATAFTYTASTLLYSFHAIICEVYYEDGKGREWHGEGDRCAIPAVDSWAAKEISFMVTLTTVAGVFNLITTGWVTQRFGIRQAMLWQSAFPILRNLCQIWGIIRGGLTGIRVLQLTQLLTIGGGGAGYMLTGNTYCSELVAPEERTVAFGRLQGTQMLGTAIGLMVGGVLGARVHLIAPFLAALVSLILSTFVNAFFLPYIPPAKASSADGKSSGMFAPVRLFTPRKVATGRFFGLTFLAIGSFVSVFASSFVPLLLQLVGTNQYGFKSDLNGYLMALASLSRAVFLSILFPRIISAGRTWYASAPAPAPAAAPSPPPETHIPTTAAEIEPLEPTIPGDPVVEPAPVPPATTEVKGSHFDLVFLRLSILLDAVLTALIPFASQGWHLFLAAGIIPLASGTAPAAKGVVLEMTEKHEHADSLQGIALFETLAMMCTVSASGIVFAKLSEIGRPLDTFLFNAASALLAFLVLLCVRFPPTTKPSPA
ncbi:hypothetical protein JCM10207_002666 [Rhodosporidiobolus poonsookiae]